MAVITPVGKEFDWSPKEQTLVKSASTGKMVNSASDKDMLYEAAKKFVKANMLDALPPAGGDAPCGEPPCNALDGAADIGGLDGAAPDVVVDVASPEDIDDAGAVGGAVGGDVQKAVKELVDKANKAEEIAGKVEEAVAKVEEAVQEVKDVVGIVGEEVEEVEGNLPDEVEIEIDETDEDEEKEEGKPFGKDEDKAEHEENETPEEEAEEEEKKDGDDIIQESKEACASKKSPHMKSAAHDDDLAKFASLSPSVKKKILDYWKNDLKYAPDYCKLLVTDN